MNPNHRQARAVLRKIITLADDPMRGVIVRLPFNLEYEIKQVLEAAPPKPISAPRMLLTLALGVLLSFAAYSCQHREKGSAVNVEAVRGYSETL